MDAAKRRVAILGGGAGGLATALELTATPELRDRFEVTVHQLGWRLGGKGASGRRTASDDHRIEEHGLHIWFGFYENAFDLIQRVYRELDRPPNAALSTWTDAFKPTNEVVLLDDTDGAWHRQKFHFPANDEIPGTAGESPPLNRLMRDALRTLRLVEPPQGAPRLLKAFDAGIDKLLLALETALGGEDGRFDLGDVLRGLVEVGDVLADIGAGHGREPFVCRALGKLRDVVWDATGGDRYAMTFDLVATTFRGILADDLDDQGFRKVNGEELSAWFLRHGARPETVTSSPILRAFYQLCFGYEGGDRTRPSIAAGKALQAMLRMCVGYRGALMWKMQAGMGDAIFAPVYEVLRRRGVRFEFFHNVTGLGLSEDGRRVERIAIDEQAQVRGGREYEPLVADPGGLPSWPAAPLWDQLVDGDALRDRAPDFERGVIPEGVAAGDPPIELRAGEDFDDVVLAIPVGALRPICGELAARHPRFAEMLDAASTVATQALQVWLRIDADALGVAPHGMVSGAYVPPFDTLCDMSHVLAREDWPEGDQVRHVAYLCGVMEEARIAGLASADADALVREDALAHLRAHALVLWPGADRGDGTLDWTLLCDADDRDGEARLEAQYWRANTVGSERYVLTPPGSVEKRLRPDESGVDNLVLAGDWTRNGICGGSVEAAVTSGKLAARALSGSPAVVPGTDGWLEAD
jgi:uncharacterized protein with NAD-binding domain and iron-sulfur cluster